MNGKLKSIKRYKNKRKNLKLFLQLISRISLMNKVIKQNFRVSEPHMKGLALDKRNPTFLYFPLESYARKHQLQFKKENQNYTQ